MKIIAIDNFNRDYIADILIAESLSRRWGEHIVNLLNGNQREDSQDYFILVENDYVLWRGMDELV